MSPALQNRRLALAVRLAAIIFVAVFCHYGFWLHAGLLGVTAETLMLGSALAGIMLGPVWGALAGFSFGMAHDLLAPTPLGLGALTFTLTSYAMAQLSTMMEARYWWQSCLYGAAGMLFGLVLFVSTGELLGQDFLIDEHFPRVLWVNAIFAVALSPAMWAVLRLATRTPQVGGTRVGARVGARGGGTTGQAHPNLGPNQI